VAFLFTFGTIGLLGGAVATLKGRTQGLLAALFLAATPYFISAGASQCADVPISFFILAVLALLSLPDRGDRSQPGFYVLAGISLGMAAWTKNEGLLLAALVVPVSVIVTWRGHGLRAALRQLAWLAAGLAPVLACVLLFKFTLATSGYFLGNRSLQDLLAAIRDRYRWKVMLVELAKGIFWFGDLPIGVPLLLTGYVVWVGADGKSYRRSILSGFATLSLLLGGYCVLCVISPADIHWQIDTALARLLLQLWPSTLFLAFLLAKPIRGETLSAT
jgi:hypothetical protein